MRWGRGGGGPDEEERVSRQPERPVRLHMSVNLEIRYLFIELMFKINFCIQLIFKTSPNAPCACERAALHSSLFTFEPLYIFCERAAIHSPAKEPLYIRRTPETDTAHSMLYTYM